MDLYIDTADKKIVHLSLRQDKQVLTEKEFAAEYKQAEKLLPTIDWLLKSVRADIEEVEMICVTNRGQSFTALRIGVVTANALAFALGIKVLSPGENEQGSKTNIVKPIYHKEPNISCVD
jgi:tRNA A37 threonylcarbamoyladenosine modification protein TsaB